MLNSTYQFSADRPFGVYLDTYFVQIYKLATGNDPNEFAFHAGITPLSTWKEIIGTFVTWLALIYGGQFLMKNLPAMKLQLLTQVHNFLLTVTSLSLLLLFIEQSFPIVYHHGIFHAVCSSDAWTQRLELLYYINYLVKYWELADTFFLALKKKPLEFLHVYHHSMTMALCYVQLIGRTSVSWLPIALNLMVHVAMYYYYFRSAGGAKIWWKKYLTTLQIIQFVLDLVFIYFCSYTYFTATYWPWMPNAGSCAGEEYAAIFGCVLLSSYLYLFVDFYRKTYTTKRSGRGESNVKQS